MKHKKTALILTGGGSRGAWQVGAIKALYKKIQPDLIIGTSVGSFNAALLATGYTPEAIEHIWKQDIKHTEFFKFNYKLLNPFIRHRSISSNKRLLTFVKKYFSDQHIEDANIKLYIDATRLSDGKNIFFDKGKLVDAMMASAAIPPYYPPYTIDGIEYIDGQISEPTGIDEARRQGAKKIIILNVLYTGGETRPYSMYQIAQHAINLLTLNSLKQQLIPRKNEELILIEPSKNYKFKLNDQSHVDQLIKDGEEDAKKALAKLTRQQ